MQIQNIVLYNHKGQIRILPFKLGAVNIITGRSKSGKSSLTAIIEYCLGKEKSEIPAGVIRKTVSWYALTLKFPNEEVFIARRAPAGVEKSSPDVYLKVGKKVQSPEFSELHGATNPSAAHDYLGGLLGISDNLHIPKPGQTRAPVSAGLKHALIFNFQCQSEIANPKFLFHRQGEPWLPQSIKDTLPFFLGAVPEDYLKEVAELRVAKSELGKLERKQREAELLRGEGIARGLSLLSEAEELKLVKATERPDSLAAVVELLSSAESNEKLTVPQVQGEEVDRLREVDRGLFRKLEGLSEELRFAKKFDREQRGFSSEAAEQKARLESIGLFEEMATHRCLACNSETDGLTANEDEIRNSISYLAEQLEGVGKSRPHLQDFIEKLENEIFSVKGQIQQNRASITAILTQHKRFRETQELLDLRNRVLGKISLYVESVRSVEQSKDFSEQLKAATVRVEELEAYLDQDNLEEAKVSILNVISRDFSKWAKDLDLEHSDDLLRLDLAKLTVVADTDEGLIAMDEMGSGANWLGAHLIAHFGLHKWFVRKKRPVPRFMFLDQPTQVYFPPDSQDDSASLVSLPNEDKLAVKKMFEWIDSRTKDLKGQMQIIITDHADIKEAWFQGAVVEKWRGDDALIPLEWIESSR